MYPKEVFPVKRKTKWMLGSLALLLAIGLGVGGWLYYGFQRDQIATLEDFSLSTKIVQKPSDKNEGTITVQCTLRNNTPSVSYTHLDVYKRQACRRFRKPGDRSRTPQGRRFVSGQNPGPTPLAHTGHSGHRSRCHTSCCHPAFLWDTV